MDKPIQYIVSKTEAVMLQKNQLVRIKKDVNHLNVVRLETGELGLVDKVQDDLVTIYMLKQHEPLDEWNNRIYFERDTYDTIGQMCMDMQATFDVIEEDRVMIAAYMLERDMYDLEMLVKSARQAFDDPDRKLDNLIRLEAFLKDDSVPRYVEPLGIERWDIIQQMRTFQADRGYL